MNAALRRDLETEGFAWIRAALPKDTLVKLDVAANMVSAVGGRAMPGGLLAGVLGSSEDIKTLVRGMSYNADPVRIVSFDKSQSANWSLPWHQDRVIAVRDKVELNDYVAWARKSGVWHCEPPIGLLENMIFIRIHLDDADDQNGCLELAPRTHKFGKIATDDTDKIARRAGRVPCVARRGDVLFVKALTLHKSSVSKNGASRRAIRIDYTRECLPSQLKWAFRTAI